MKAKLKVDLKLKDGTNIKAGTSAEIEFAEKTASIIKCKFEGLGERIVNLSVKSAHKNFGSPFKKEPSLRSLEKWVEDGIAQTVTGKRTETDGHGDDGSPSWLLVLGLI